MINVSYWQFKSSLQCVQQQTEGSSGQGSGDDCDYPTGLSVLSTSPPPPGWDETWQSPQTPPETKERKRERRIRTHYSRFSAGVILCNWHYYELNADGRKAQRKRYELKTVTLDWVRVSASNQDIVMGGIRGDTDGDDECGHCEGPLRRREWGDAGVETRQRGNCGPPSLPSRFTLQHQNPSSHWSAHRRLRHDKRTLELPPPLHLDAVFIEFWFLFGAHPIRASACNS